MLKNKTKEPPRQPNSDAIAQRADGIAQPLPDPWLTPSPAQKAEPVPKTWQLPREPYPLISPTGSREAPRLPTPKPASGQILLEDELKLKVGISSLLKQQLEKALALIYWLGTIEQPTQLMGNVAPLLPQCKRGASS
jgi:hypothetical protein